MRQDKVVVISFAIKSTKQAKSLAERIDLRVKALYIRNSSIGRLRELNSFICLTRLDLIIASFTRRGILSLKIRYSKNDANLSLILINDVSIYKNLCIANRPIYSSAIIPSASFYTSTCNLAMTEASELYIFSMLLLVSLIYVIFCFLIIIDEM